MDNFAPLLSICIPTYNRPEEIKKMMLDIIGLDNIHLVEVIIIDNCSLVPVSEIYKKMNINIPNLRIHRNSVNIGGNPNILRCIEYAETDWVWLLGDDDTLLVSAITLILGDIYKNDLTTDTILIKYNCKLGENKQQIIINEFETLFNYITTNQCFSNFLFMSTCVINKKSFCEYYIDALQNSYCNFAHLYPVFMLSFYKKLNVFMSSNKICIGGGINIKNGWIWPIVYCDLLRGFSALPFINKYKLRIIARKWLKFNLVRIVYACCFLSTKNFNTKSIIRCYKYYCLFSFSFIQRLVLLPFSLLFYTILSANCFPALYSFGNEILKKRKMKK